MKVQLYTLNEIIDTLRRISRKEDSITKALRAGDFRYRFETFVSESRAKRDTGNVLTLPSRLVAITHHGKEVFVLDDIQGAVTKKQFAKFMQFVKAQQVAIHTMETTYIPIDLVDLFVQSEHQPDELLKEVPAMETDEESSSLTFA